MDALIMEYSTDALICWHFKGPSRSLGPTAPLIATPLQASTHALKPKRYRQSQLPASLFTQSSSQSQTSDSQSQSSEASSKHRSPLTKSPPTPSFTQTTLKRSSLTRSKTPGGLGRKDPGVAVKGETPVKRKLFSSHQVQKTVEEVQKKVNAKVVKFNILIRNHPACKCDVLLKFYSNPRSLHTHWLQQVTKRHSDIPLASM